MSLQSEKKETSRQRVDAKNGVKQSESVRGSKLAVTDASVCLEDRGRDRASVSVRSRLRVRMLWVEQAPSRAGGEGRQTAAQYRETKGGRPNCPCAHVG